MGMSILHMLSLRDVLHTAGWASASLIAAATLAMHRADVCRSVLLAGSVRTVGSSAMLVVASASSESKCNYGENGKKKLFHVGSFFVKKSALGWYFGGFVF